MPNEVPFILVNPTSLNGAVTVAETELIPAEAGAVLDVFVSVVGWLNRALVVVDCSGKKASRSTSSQYIGSFWIYSLVLPYLRISNVTVIWIVRDWVVEVTLSWP